MVKSLNPHVVIPGHGNPGSAKILDDMESYYNRLVDGVGQMVKQGKSLDQIKMELKIPGTETGRGRIGLPKTSRPLTGASPADEHEHTCSVKTDEQCPKGGVGGGHTVAVLGSPPHHQPTLFARGIVLSLRRATGTLRISALIAGRRTPGRPTAGTGIAVFTAPPRR